MNKSLVLKNKFYFYLSFLFTFFLFVYLLYFLVNGERGLLKYFSLKNLNAQYNEQYLSLKMENEFYLDRIKRLQPNTCLLYTSPSPRDIPLSRMPSSA